MIAEDAPHFTRDVVLGSMGDLDAERIIAKHAARQGLVGVLVDMLIHDSSANRHSAPRGRWVWKSSLRRGRISNMLGCERTCSLLLAFD
jgi:hypothetical protein